MPILNPTVKTRVLITLLVLLAAPAAALASPRDKTDGTLAVKGARGLVVVAGRGTILGRLDAGSVTITDVNPFDQNGPQVYGADGAPSIDGNATTWRGSGLRFRFIDGAYRVTIVGRGLDVSAVGQGRARLIGTDGQYSLDGAVFQDLPATVPFAGAFGGTAAAGG